MAITARSEQNEERRRWSDLRSHLDSFEKTNVLSEDQRKKLDSLIRSYIQSIKWHEEAKFKIELNQLIKSMRRLCE